MNRTAKLAIGVLGAIALVLGGAVAYAAIPSANGTIRACYDNGGNLKLIDEGASCPKGYKGPISWNQQGQPGTNGTNGVSGYEVVQKHDTIIETSGSDFTTVSVACPLGKVAVGGGGTGVAVAEEQDGLFLGIGLADMRASWPIEGDANDPAEWAVRFGKANGTAFAANQGVTYDLFVTCVTAT